MNIPVDWLYILYKNLPIVTFTLFQVLYYSKPMSRDNDLFVEADPALVPEAVPIETQEESQRQEQLGQRQAKGDRLSSSNVECSSHRQRVLKLCKCHVSFLTLLKPAC